jgi:FkbM family methyltransferase
MTTIAERDFETIVTELYWLMLGRAPDPEGFRHNLAFLTSRAGSPQDLARAFAASPEFVGGSSLSGPVSLVRAHECEFVLPLGTSAAEAMGAPGGYEPWVLPYFLDHCRPGMTVVDVGASWGAYALPGAKRVGPSGRVFAIEVSSANCRVLLRSLRASHIDNVKILPVALSDQLGAELMPRQDFTNNNAIGGSFAEKLNFLDQHDVVPTVPLDLLASALGPVHLMKIDIEGMEYKALVGGARLMRENRPILFMEYSPRFQALGSGVEGGRLLELLLDLGYAIEILHRDRPRQTVSSASIVDVISEVDGAWRRHFEEDGGSHLDLCLRPSAGGEAV